MSQRLVGRGHEQTWLRALLRHPERSRGTFALVEGEAGIGKSALLASVLAIARSRGFDVRVSAADELDRRRPFSLVEALLGPVDVARPSAGAAGVIRPHVEADVAEILVDRALALARERSLLLVAEDLQWADNASLAVLGRLARRLPESPILVLATARRAPRATPLDRLIAEAVPDERRLRLAPLSGEDVRLLVARTTRATPGPGLLEQLDAASGNPLLLLELLAALERMAALTRTEDGVDAGPLVLPQGIAGAVATRLLVLPPDVRDILRVAAVLGRTFRAVDLAGVLACPSAQLVGPLAAAQDAGLVEPCEGGLTFRHELIRAALVDGLAPTVQRALHLDAARALAAANASPGRVAEHLARGAETGSVEVVERLAATAHDLAATSPDDAAELFELAMTLAGSGDPRWPELACDRAVALWWAGRPVEAELLAEASLGAGANGPTAGRAMLARAHCLQALGRLPEALEVARAAAAAASPSTQPHAAASAAFSSLYLGDRQRAIDDAEAARRGAAEIGDAVAGCFALQVLVLGHGMAGRFSYAVELAREAARLGDSEPGRAGHRFAGHVMLGGFLVHLDRLDEAERVIADGRLLLEQLGDRTALAFLAFTRAIVCFEAGQWPEADAELAAGMLAARGLGAGWLLAPLGLQALLALHRGQLAQARELLARTIEARGAGGAAPFTELAVLAAARLHEADDRPDLARAVLDEAWDTATARGSVAEYPGLALDLVRLSLDAGAPDRARVVADGLSALAAAHPDVPTLQGKALRCRALVERDRDALLRAVDTHRSGPRPLELALALGEAAVVEARSDERRALALLDESQQLLIALGARHDLVRVVAAARQAGLRPGRRPGRALEGVDALTPAERVVAELVARGLTNPEIGARLYVSRNTVRTHVSSALGKLGCRSRAELAVVMVLPDAR